MFKLFLKNNLYVVFIIVSELQLVYYAVPADWANIYHNIIRTTDEIQIFHCTFIVYISLEIHFCRNKYQPISIEEHLSEPQEK